MIVLQSLVTALAERPIGKRKRGVAVPSPGGEGQGEGGLTCSSGREPALTVILASDFWILNSHLLAPLLSPPNASTDKYR